MSPFFSKGTAMKLTKRSDLHPPKSSYAGSDLRRAQAKADKVFSGCLENLDPSKTELDFLPR